MIKPSKSGEELLLVLDSDGYAKEYDDTWDIVIHCETEEERNNFMKLLNEFLSKRKKAKK